MSELFQYKLRVYLDDTDMFGVVYHSNYLIYLERARTEFLRSKGVLLSDVQAQSISLVVSSIEIDYLKPARVDDALCCEVELIKKKMAMAVFSQKIYNEKGDLLTTAMVKIVSLNHDNQLYPMERVLNAS
jgi:acyl-CoA thioester hydrolase